MVVKELDTTLEDRLEHEIDPDIQAELRDHPGSWVAITRSEIIAIADNVTEVLAEAARQGVDQPIIFQVPRDEGSAYFF